MTDEDAFWSVCKGEILVSNSSKKIGIQVDVGVFKTHFLMSFSVLELYLKWIAHCIISAIASERVEGLHSIVDITPINILFSSNHNIHKSSHGLCFWASDPLIERF